MSQVIHRVKGVTPIEGEILRFYVDSRSEPGVQRLVDLESYNFNSECDCPDFRCNKEKYLKMGAYPADNLRCWHIHQVRAWLLEALLPKLAEQQYVTLADFQKAQQLESV